MSSPCNHQWTNHQKFGCDNFGLVFGWFELLNHVESQMPQTLFLHVMGTILQSLPHLDFPQNVAMGQTWELNKWFMSGASPCFTSG